MDCFLDKMLIKVKLLFSSFRWLTDRDMKCLWGRDERKGENREGGVAIETKDQLMLP